MGRKKGSGPDAKSEAAQARREARWAEMEAQGCPHGRDNNGNPRLRPLVPPELRSYYVLYGMPKHGNTIQYIARFKTQLSAARDIEKWSGMLANNYATLELVRCKRVKFVEL